MLDISDQNQAARQAQGQTQDIDSRKHPLTDQVSIGDFKVVLEHGCRN